MARRVIRMRGVEKVMRNINREVKRIKGRSLEGLIQAAILIIRDTDNTPPVTPVDYGNLRASRFVTAGFGDRFKEAGTFSGPDAAKLKGDHNSVLAASGGKAKSSPKDRPIVILGFSAHYGTFVHEMKDFNVNRQAELGRRAGAGPKFFESSLNNLKPVIVPTIKQYAKK